MTLYVDHATLDSISLNLQEASNQLDSLSGALPGSVDAGDATPAIVGILAKLAENAGQLVVALAAAAAAVGDANAEYRQRDAETVDQLAIVAWSVE